MVTENGIQVKTWKNSKNSFKNDFRVFKLWLRQLLAILTPVFEVKNHFFTQRFSRCPPFFFSGGVEKRLFP
jgi:hypothetical protein